MNLRMSPENNIITNDSPKEVSEEQLVSAAKSGDADAFVELSKRHSHRLLQRAYQITRNWHDAEDAVQDSLLKAFSHLKDFEERSRFSYWLTQITTNSALMILRKKRVYLEIPIDGADAHPGTWEAWEPRDRGQNPEDHCAQQEREELLRRAICRLPPVFRDAVQLQYAQEWSAPELAQALGISVAAVKSRLTRARMALRRSLLERRWQLDPMGRS
jgi:RNA polymerase sigma-70 factor (ECF subfamily)